MDIFTVQAGADPGFCMGGGDRTLKLGFLFKYEMVTEVGGVLEGRGPRPLGPRP